MLNGLRREKNITADIAYLSGDMLNYNDTVALAHSPHNFALFVLAWAIRNTTPHLDLLSLLE